MTERFRMAMPVYDHAAEDAELLAAVESSMCGEEWRDCVERAGGRPAGEPEVRREPNPSYGMVISGEDGGPMLGADGKPLVDHIKLYLIADGWAER